MTHVNREGEVLVGNVDTSVDLLNLPKGIRVPLPREYGGMKIDYWNEPSCGAVIGYVAAATNRSGIKCASTRVSGSIAVDTQGNMLFEPIPLWIHYGFRRWDEACGTDARGSIHLIDRKGEKTFSFPREWGMRTFHWDDDQRIAEFVLHDKKAYRQDKYNTPVYVAERNMAWMKGPFLEAFELTEGLRYVRCMDGTVSFVDKDWNECFCVPQDCTDNLESNFCHGHVAFGKWSNRAYRYGLFDRNGNVTMKPTFMSLFHLGGPFWWYRKGEGYGIVHESGEIMTPPNFRASWGSTLQNGLILAGRKGNLRKNNVGFLNTDWEWEIEPKFEWASDFIHPMYAVAGYDC